MSPCCEPSTTATYAFATSAAERPAAGSIPSFTIVSFVHGGLTALMRSRRGISSAAARTKPSRPALSSDTDALPRIGCIANVPVVRVIEPPSRRRVAGNSRRRHLPHELAAEFELIMMQSTSVFAYDLEKNAGSKLRRPALYVGIKERDPPSLVSFSGNAIESHGPHHVTGAPN